MTTSLGSYVVLCEMPHMDGNVAILLIYTLYQWARYRIFFPIFFLSLLHSFGSPLTPASMASIPSPSCPPRSTQYRCSCPRLPPRARLTPPGRGHAHTLVGRGVCSHQGECRTSTSGRGVAPSLMGHVEGAAVQPCISCRCVDDLSNAKQETRTRSPTLELGGQ